MFPSVTGGSLKRVTLGKAEQSPTSSVGGQCGWSSREREGEREKFMEGSFIFVDIKLLFNAFAYIFV